MNSDLDGFFDKNLGEVEFVWEETKESTNNIICNKKSHSLGLNR